MARDSQAATGPTSSAGSAVTSPIPAQPRTTQPTSQSTAPASAAELKTRAGSAKANAAVVDGVRFFEPRDSRIEKATDLGSVQVLKHGNLFMLTDQFGDVHADSRGLGLYRDDSRLLSCSVLRVGGARPVALQGSTGANYRGVIQLTNPTLARNPDDKINPGQGLVGKKLGITCDRLLTIATTDTRVTFRYDGLDERQRRTHVAFSEPATIEAVRPGDPTDQGGTIRLRWVWPLEAGGDHELTWTVWSSKSAVPEATPAGTGAELFPEIPRVAADEGAAAYHAWTRSTTAVAADHELFNLTIARSVADLRLLVNEGPRAGERYIAAGVPWFTTLFGRDSIIVALQTLAFRPQIAVEILDVLAALQATEVDDWRDAEPGKILHELRQGETALDGELPHSPYYGSVDSTPLWLILLGATYDWTGDLSIVDRLWPNALAALRWIDEWGDRDGDGFVEYERRSPRGLLNQGWKDSGDAIRDRNGQQMVAPIALAEVQGYVFDAKRRMAALARIRSEDELANRLEADAEKLRTRFEEAFWVEDQRYYAMALDS